MNGEELTQFATFELRKNIRHFVHVLNEERCRQAIVANEITSDDLCKIKWIANPVFIHVHRSPKLPQASLTSPTTAHKDIRRSNDRRKNSTRHSSSSSSSSSVDTSDNSSDSSTLKLHAASTHKTTTKNNSYLEMTLTGVLPSQEKVILTFYLEPLAHSTDIKLIRKPWYIALSELLHCW
jgi:hypothetical protein